MTEIQMEVLPGRFVIGRLADGEPWPMDPGVLYWLVGDHGTRSIACPEDRAPICLLARSDPWRALRLRGPIDLGASGVLVRVLAPLADAGISILTVSSFETDIVLVPSHELAQGLDALRRAGHRVRDDAA